MRELIASISVSFNDKSARSRDHAGENRGACQFRSSSLGSFHRSSHGNEAVRGEPRLIGDLPSMENETGANNGGSAMQIYFYPEFHKKILLILHHRVFEENEETL